VSKASDDNNFLCLYFYQLYRQNGKLPVPIFKVDEQLSLCRNESPKERQIVAVVSPTTTHNDRDITEYEKDDDDARDRVLTYLYLCSLVSYIHAQDLWFRYEDHSPAEFAGQQQEPM
jgi:hypothetical protein